jgi:acyl-CoA synthetase (AMP-forming)/AMP-acid ligase II
MHLLARLARHAADRPAAVAYRDAATGATLTWGELHRRVTAARPAPGPAIIRLENTLDFPVAFLAALAAGRPAFPISPTESPATVRSAADRAADAPPGLLLLSSGSTGLPKVVHRSVAAVDAVCEQMVGAVGFAPDDTVLATVPLCHSYGIEHGLLAPVWAGSAVSLCRGLDVAVLRRELMESRITVLPAVPSAFEALARLDLPIPNVTAYSAGGPLPPAVAAACRDRLGLRIGQVYGATEIGSVTYGDGTDGSVGRPMPGVTLRIDADGQVMVAAPSLFDGYLGGDVNPTTPDRFYPTGDLGHLDAAGRLHVHGRVQLLIDVGGRKVNPLEVEAVLLDHPHVGGCVVVPVQQTATVARLKAIVEPRHPGPVPDVDDLRAYARERLAPHKVPRTFEVRDALPRSGAGKVLRQQVLA